MVVDVELEDETLLVVCKKAYADNRICVPKHCHN